MNYDDGSHDHIDHHCSKYWIDDGGDWHRDVGHATIRVDGKMVWYRHGVIHRDDGPAIVHANGLLIWRSHGAYMRIDGPSSIDGMGRLGFYDGRSSFLCFTTIG